MKALLIIGIILLYLVIGFFVSLNVMAEETTSVDINYAPKKVFIDFICVFLAWPIVVSYEKLAILFNEHFKPFLFDLILKTRKKKGFDT